MSDEVVQLKAKIAMLERSVRRVAALVPHTCPNDGGRYADCAGCAARIEYEMPGLVADSNGAPLQLHVLWYREPKGEKWHPVGDAFDTRELLRENIKNLSGTYRIGVYVRDGSSTTTRVP